MRIADGFISELQHEGKSLRAALERIPEDKLDWQPHAKSMTLRALASHLVDMFDWTEVMVKQEVFDMDPAMEQYKAESVADLLATFDKNFARTLELLEQTGDAEMMAMWTMKVSGHELFTLPRVAVIRTWTISHMIHHRAQLGVYLRLLDVAVPEMYGPTADEGQMAGA